MFDDLNVFFRGILLGVMVAAPVGPVGLLCIRRTVSKGLVIGFASGFGAAFADALFSAVAAFGVTAITQTLQTYNDPLLVVGGLFLLVIAWHAWHDKPRQPHLRDLEDRYLRRFGWGFRFGGALKAMATSFVITITNPGTVVGVLAVVATFGGLKSRMESSAIITGIFIGSSLWWLLLAGGVSLVRKKFTESSIMKLNRLTAAALALMALGALTMGVLSWAGIEAPLTQNLG